MGDKTLKNMVELMKTICMYEKAMLQEVTLLRRDFNKHMSMQQIALKEWMQKDLDHHFKDNKVALSAIEMIKEKAREKELKS